MYVCVYVCVYVCMSVCIVACMFACLYACMYVYVYVSVSCVQVTLFMDGWADKHYRHVDADGRECLGVSTSDEQRAHIRERECSLGPRGHGAQAVK